LGSDLETRNYIFDVDSSDKNTDYTDNTPDSLKSIR